MKNKKIVLIQGAFDILNYGHVRAFRRAKSEGDYLIVALNTNPLILDYKQRIAVMPWRQKKIILESIRYIDKVVVAPDFSPMKLLRKYDVDVYCLTREWEPTKAEELAYMKKKGGRVVFMPRYKGAIPTSEIKKRLLAEHLSNEGVTK